MTGPRLEITVKKVSHDRKRVETLETVEVPLDLARSYADGLEQMGTQLDDLIDPEE